MSQLKPGARLCSAVCTTEVVVIAAAGEATICCGGTQMSGEGGQAIDGHTLDTGAAGGTQLGKRYTNEIGNIELLCVKPGEGSLTIDGVALVLKGAKPLPSSD